MDKITICKTLNPSEYLPQIDMSEAETDFINAVSENNENIYSILYQESLVGLALSINRNHTFTVEQFNQIMTYDANDEMQKKWKAFVKKINTKTDDFKTVLDTIKEFLKEPFTMAVDDAEYAKYWSTHTGIWK